MAVSVSGPQGGTEGAVRLQRGVSVGATWMMTILAFVISRLSILPTSLEFRSDEILYRDWGLEILSGVFPAGDERYQYPPGAGLFFAFLEWIPGTFHRAFTASVLIADAAVLVMLLVAVYRQRASWFGPWTWIVGGALAGGLLYERFDVISAVFGVAALLVVARPFLSGFLAGCGAMVKVWPIFVLFGQDRRQLGKAILGAASGIAAMFLVSFVIADDALSFLSSQAGRGLQIESTPAAPILIAGQLGLLETTGVDRFGSTEIESSFAGVAAWLGIAVAVVLLAVLLVQRLRGRLEGVPSADVALAALLVFWALNRVNSSQFFIWVAAIAAVALLNRRSRMVVPVALAFLSMLPIDEYLGPYFWALQGQNPEAVFLQVVRSVLVLASAVLAWYYVVVGRSYDDRETQHVR